RARRAGARAAARRRSPASRRRGLVAARPTRRAGSRAMNVFESRLDAAGLRVGVVVARFNHLICARLLEGCAGELRRRGLRERARDVAWVPGAFEIPLAASGLAASGRYDALVALGVVVRGGTPHFEYVCRGVAEGVMRAMLDRGVPIALGVLTVDDA